MLNPYEAPTSIDERSAAVSKVFPAAVGLIVVSILDITLNGLAAVFGIGRAFDPAAGEEMKRTFLEYSAYNLIHAVYAVPVLVGAIYMARLKSYLFSMVAVWLAVVPFFAPCFLLAIPFGIWGILVLRRPDVRAAFGVGGSV